MSLVVWLPLTKDTRNQGLVNIISNNNAVTFTNGGKLGEKYFSAGTITIPASYSSSIFNGTHISFSFWLKPIGTDGTSVIFGQSSMNVGNNRMYSIFQYPTPNDLHISWQSETSSSTFVTFTRTGFFEADKWTHCALVYDGSKVLVYKNGVLNSTYDGVNTRTAFNYDYPINASSIRCLNDFRIYDHCLSQMEVKELAKGLVLHYPLNRNGWGQENLVTNSSSEWSAWYTPSVNGTNQTSSPGTATLPASKNVGDIYSCSVEIEFSGVSAGSDGTFAFRAQGSSTSGWVGGNPWSKLFFSGTIPVNGIYRYAWTGSITSASVNDTTFSCGFRADYWGGGKYRVRLIKMEPGEISTPWCPHSTQTIYNTMGLNSTTEYDCSGFCNNGTRVGTFEWSSDTPKYNVSTEFNNSNYINIGTQLYSMKDEVTVNLWVYKPDWSVASGTPFSSVEGGGYGWQVNGTNLQVLCGTGTTSNSYWSVTLTTNNLSAGWHMFTLTYNGMVCKAYIDAIEKNSTTKYTTKTPIYYNNNSAMFIGGESSGNLTAPSSGLWTGKISDVRIYATALSADDVKSLYQNCATIDSDGTIRGQIRS